MEGCGCRHEDRRRMKGPRAEALDRTLRLMRDHLRDTVPDAELLAALGNHPVCLVADRYNLESETGQHAFVATALLCARMGIPVEFEAPDVRMEGVHAPLQGGYLVEALLGIGRDLIPDIGISEGRRKAATVITIGDTATSASAEQSLAISGNDSTGRVHLPCQGTRWRRERLPLGALAAAGLAAGEVYKAAMRRLRPWCRFETIFDDYFRPTTPAAVRLTSDKTPPITTDLGTSTMISGGAIAQACLFALSRVQSVRAHVTVIEPEPSDPTNLNRYALLRRSDISNPKVASLDRLDLGGIAIQPVPERFDTELVNAAEHDFNHDLLVGVDDIPTRWLAQDQLPQWLGVGATTHYYAMTSYHVLGLPCARCLHPRDDQGRGPIPTVSFVSHWAGLWLAAYYLRQKAGEMITPAEQQVFMGTLRPDTRTGVWRSSVARRAECPCCGQPTVA